MDQLFNSSEKRLARALLLLAHFGKEGVPETVIPKISQETLAEMVVCSGPSSSATIHAPFLLLVFDRKLIFGSLNVLLELKRVL
jgi:hypothetical protein